MTGASKILTVSYGTFSCTLEGFDDPFNTMKAIAEYFRDLAAEDRYFGAEPPTPDAAMLHRIAEREIHRRVEAKIQDNGVILRAGEPQEAPEAPRPTLAPAAGPAAAQSTSDSVAEKLQRIRAKHAPAAVAAPVAMPADDSYSEDEHAEDLPVSDAAGLAEAALQIDIPDQLEEILTEAETAPTDEVFEDEAYDDETYEDEPTHAAAELLSDLDEVSNEDEVIDFTDQFSDLPDSEDFAAPEAHGKEPDDLALFSGLSDALAADPLPEDAAPEASIENLPEDLLEDLPEELQEDFDDAMDDADDGILAALDAVDAPQDEPALTAPTPIAPTLGTGSDDDVLARLGALIDPEDDDVDLTVDAAAAEPVEAPAAVIDEASAVEEANAVEEVSAVEAAEAPAPQRARARVIRIRRADPIAEAPVAEVVPPSAEGALSAEAEAALQAELAALEAELGADIDAPAAEAVAQPAPAPQAVPVAKAEDDAVSRLMAQADDAMGEDENLRRQSAIAHLKAAVAATTADRTFVDKAEKAQATKLDTYREDLERVVRPRRPVAETSTPRPAMPGAEAAPRPTPLVLVSEQRIDRPRVAANPATPRSVMPVRPRRVTSEVFEAEPMRAPLPTTHSMAAVSAAQVAEDEDLVDGDDTDNVFSDSTSFGDFADQLGATELPDLLEAAAVYCAEVLQRPEFSRPLVMRQLTTLADQAPTNREDYLRGFGTLLRQGRIAKVKRGLFALTDRSPYLAEARKIAG